MYYDAAEALPEKPLPKEEVQPVGGRYDGSIMVFGKAMQVSYPTRRSCKGIFDFLTNPKLYTNARNLKYLIFSAYLGIDRSNRARELRMLQSLWRVRW